MDREKVVGALTFLIVLMASGCGGGGQNITPPPPPPKITLGNVAAYYSVTSPLNLNYAIAGESAFTLLANGSGFTTSSVIEWNGAPLATTFGDSADLAAAVSASLIATPGTVSVTVKDSSSGVTSNAMPFGIASPAAATASVIQLITIATDGSPANADSLVSPSINSDGRYVAFQSVATNLVPGAASGFQDIYLRDTCLGSAPAGCVPSTARISVTYNGSPTNFHSYDSSLSPDGRFVAFDSEATNILPGTASCGNTCVFLRDTCNGAPVGCVPSTTLISVAVDGATAGGGNPSISAGGEFVAFSSNSTNIVNGDNNAVADAFVRDTCNGAPAGCTPSNELVSISSTGTQGNSTSGLSAISATGRFVAFQSWASNLTSNENSAIEPNMFVRDTCVGAPASCSPTTTRLDIATDGTVANSSVFQAIPAISGEGRIVAFGSRATNLVSLNVGGQGNVYVRDTCAGAAAGCAPSTDLVSLANDGSTANCGSPSQGLSMSADGRFVAFDSIATNLVPGDTFPACGFEDIFIRDTCFGAASGCAPSTVRASVSNAPNLAAQANNISGYPAISTDGHYVVFLSAATNLIPGGANGHTMVFLAKTGF
jgi:trimeric autotransporter adhesin